MKKKIKVGNNILSSIGSFSFGGMTPKYFDKHISQSIPFYNEGHEIVTNLSSFFLNKSSIAYDLGCSTGSLIKKIDTYNSKLNFKIIGIDYEKKMIIQAKKKNKSPNNKVNFNCSNLLKLNFKKSDLIISYYTMQFIRPKDRQKLFNKIYKSLNWGGAFIFFEKVRAKDARFQDYMTQIYNEFKKSKNFSEKNVYNKSLSLRNVLEPYTSEENRKFLKRSGFIDYMTIFKHINFEGFLAIK